jgi:hypothetical protein
VLETYLPGPPRGSCTHCHFSAGIAKGKKEDGEPEFARDEGDFFWQLRTEAKWQKLLFSINSTDAIKEQLDNGNLPEEMREELRRQFGEDEFIVAKKAVVGGWLITGSERKYDIREEGENVSKLRVYRRK